MVFQLIDVVIVERVSSDDFRPRDTTLEIAFSVINNTRKRGIDP